MNISFISTVPSLTIGSLTWASVGASVTVDTATLKAYERVNLELEYSKGNLISNPKLVNNSISATEDNVSPTALGGDVRAAVSGGNVVLSAPGIPSIQTGSSVAVQDEGTQVVAAASAINFRGAGVTATAGAGGTVNVDVPGAGARTTNVALRRPWGLGATFSTGGGSGAIQQFLGKECLDAGVSAVRVWVFSKEPINESSGWEVIVAPTDKETNDSVANAFYPQVGGTQYNLFAEAAADKTNVANQFGWRRAQWGGQFNDGRASKSGRLRPASNFRSQTQASGYYPVPGVIVSDWIDIKTVPASDGRHYMLWRAKKAAVVGETSAFSNDASTAWKTASAFPWWRREFVMSHTADAISTLTAVPTAPTEANYQWKPTVVAFEYRYNVPVRSVAACGDSITESGGLQSYGRNNWLLQAVGSISTADKPFVPVNLGFSTNTFANFFGQIEQMYASGLRPTDVIIPNMSFNDFGEYGAVQSGTQFLLSQMQARLLRSIEMIRRFGGTPYVTTDFHNLLLNSVNAPYNQLHADMYAFTLKLRDSGACKVVDWRANWQTSYDDGVHATQTGIDVQANLVAAALQS